MPRSDLFPPDIMDKHAAFAGAINQYLRLVQDWEIRRFDPNQPRIPAGQPGAGQWLDENGGDPVAEEAPLAEAPRSDSPQASPAAPTDGVSRFQISLRPADIPKPDDPFLSEAGRDPSAAMLARQARTVPTYVAMYSLPTFVDPTIGFPRSAESFFIGSADLTRFGAPYVEAYRFDTFKDLFLIALPKHQFHHIVEQNQYPYFTDRPNDPRSVNNSSNIVILHEDTHLCVSSEYSSNIAPGLTLRESLRGKPYFYQYQVGLETIKKCQSDPDRQSSRETSTQNQNEGQTTTFPPFVLPPFPPRIPGKWRNPEESRPVLFTSVKLEYKSMEKSNNEVDATYLMALLEELDEVSAEFNQETVKQANQIKEKAWSYLAKFEKDDEFWEQLIPFLSSSRKMIRVWVAVEMFRGGRKDGWPTFVSDVLPSLPRSQYTKEQRTKNFVAESYATFFINLSHQILDDLGVSPSLSEMEDQWIAEGRITNRFVRVP